MISTHEFFCATRLYAGYRKEHSKSRLCDG